MTTKTRKVANIANDVIETINGGPLAGYRNAIINGNFDFWQRGSSLSSGTGNRYLADRWKTDAITSTYSVSRQSFTIGQNDVPNEPKYYHRNIVSSVAGASNACLLIQSIEGVRTFAGQTITLSFYAKADATKSISTEFRQFFGNGGSPSVEVNSIGVNKFNLTTTWQKFTVTTSIPSISGKTLGTNNNDTLDIFFWFDAGSTYNSRTNTLGQQSGTFDIAQVQIEPGNQATPFEKRYFGAELSLCQRYYEKSYGLENPPGTVGDANLLLSRYLDGYVFSGIRLGLICFKFSTEKRTLPAMTYYSILTGSSGVITNQSTSTDFAITGQNIGRTGGRVWAIETNTTVSYINFYAHYTANAEL